MHVMIKKTYSAFLKALEVLWGIDTAKIFDVQLRFGRKLDLKNPKTLADKVSYIELHDRSPLASVCTDKYEVRKYVEERGLADILVPLVGGPWTSVDEVKFTTMPSSFVLKATHGYKMNYIVPDSSELDWKKCRKSMKAWLNTTFGTYTIEPHYKDIPHRIYAENYLGNMSDLIDYKFHCLNGEPEFVLAIADRKCEGGERMQATLNLFDMNWKRIPEIQSVGLEVAGCGDVPKPMLFDEMIGVARRLSEGFKFVRVDLYEKNGKIYFGELTFTPAMGAFPNFTDKFIREMGEKLVI